MRVRIKRFVEDSNVFEDVDDPLTAKQEFTLGHRVKELLDGSSIITRVDLISRHHGIVDLPEKQAKKLIGYGFAHEPTEGDEAEDLARRKLLEMGARETLKRLGLK